MIQSIFLTTSSAGKVVNSLLFSSSVVCGIISTNEMKNHEKLMVVSKVFSVILKLQKHCSSKNFYGFWSFYQ